jgi:undecaprenyl-diphosphatase
VSTTTVLDPPHPERPSELWDTLARFDQAAERVADRFRGRPPADLGAAALSNLSDYGFVWAVIAAGKARRGGRFRLGPIEALAVAGISSYSVNKALKALIRRPRPEGALPSGDDAPGSNGSRVALPVRTPTSSSFPSGHTLAATCTAVVLAENRRETVAFLGLAVAVAASRVHLRDHHPSDVIGGVVVGATLGVVGRRVLATAHRHRPARLR